MIHSIVSLSDIFCNDKLPPAEFVKIKGGLLEVSTANGKKRVSRLYSTDPKMYLDKKYQPYSIFK